MTEESGIGSEEGSGSVKGDTEEGVADAAEGASEGCW